MTELRNGLVQWKGLIVILIPILGGMWLMFNERMNRIETHIITRVEYREDQRRTNDLLLKLVEKISRLERPAD